MGFSYGDTRIDNAAENNDSSRSTEDAEPMGPRPPPDLEQAMTEPFIPSTELVELMAPSTVMVYFNEPIYIFCWINVLRFL